MRKMIFTLMLAIVSSVWTLSNAMCLGSIPDAMYQPYTTVSGTIQALPLPCEPGEVCPPCLTEAIVTNDKTYYLTTKNQQVADFLEQIQTSPVPAIYLLPLKATASGTPYQMGSFDYLLISSLNELSVEYFSYQQENKLPSLCDEWNVWHESFESFGPINFNQVIKYRLTTDTIINGQTYLRLVSGSSTYVGALREGNNRDIYYIPAWQTQEYLIYAFNAQVGDTLSNLWIGVTFFEEAAYQGVVQSISNDNPRIFTIQVKDIYQTHEDTTTYPIYWIEGVGSLQTPYGMEPTPTSLADVGVYTLLCAYKNGEQIYTSRMGEQYGCEYSTQDEKKKIIGTWQVYKETLSGNDYNEHGEIEYLSRTRDVNDSRTYNFDDSTLLIVCPTCYYTPKHYVLTPKGPTTWNLWVENMFTIQQKPSDPAEEGFSTITIHQLTGNLMEWEYIAYGGDEGPITWYQYLRRVGTQDSDTIPLYAQDDSGSSTVDPVDPNQVVATLQGDQLTIHENMGVDITYSLQHTAPAQTPSQHKAPQSDTFRDEVTIHITESGEYLLQLTNPSWGYTIFGQFYYAPQGIVEVPSSLQGEDRGRLILQNGQLLILRGEKVYTLQGQEVR